MVYCVPCFLHRKFCYLLLGSYDGSVRLCNVDTGENIHTLNGHTDTVYGVSFSPDGKYICSGSEDKTVRLWNVDTGKCIRTLEGHTEAVTSVSFSPDGNYICSGSYDETVRLWNTEMAILSTP